MLPTLLVSTLPTSWHEAFGYDLEAVVEEPRLGGRPEALPGAGLGAVARDDLRGDTPELVQVKPPSR
jgi:hypothetical protein